MSESRRVYQTQSTAPFVRLTYLWAALGGAMVVLVDRHDSGSWSPAAIIAMAAFVIAYLLWGERVGTRIGLEESEGRFIDRGWYFNRKVPIAETARFDHRKNRRWDRGYLVKKSGRSVALQGLTQGRRVTFDGRETSDVVALLNARSAELADAQDRS